MIVPMKKATLIALKEDVDELILELQKCGEFMIIPPENEGEQKSSSADKVDLKAQQTEAMLKLMNKYHKSGFFEDRPVVDYDTFTAENIKGESLAAETSRVSAEITTLETEISAIQNQNIQLEPWKGLDLPLDQLESAKSVRIITGFVQPMIEDDVKQLISENDADCYELGLTGEGRAVAMVVYEGDAEGMIDGLKTIGFNESTPPKLSGTADQLIASNLKKIEDCEQKIETYDKELADLSKGKTDLELLKDQYDSEEERQAVRYGETVETAILEGWVRSDKVSTIEKTVAQVTDCYDLEFIDPPEGEQPPTVTKNSKFLSQFETITDMFARPEPGTLDPAPIAGPWYWLIFGMMMGDVGYGICMLVMFGAFLKIKKPKGDFGKLVRVLFYSSFTTILFGVLFGSYFGAEWFPPILFVPLEDPITMMIVCLVIGVLHMFCGMGIAIAEKVKNGKPLDAIFDELSWMVLLTGLGFLFIPALATIGKWMAIVGAAVIFLTAGREKPTIVGKITGGLLGLYDISSYVSDILSYSRILALSLATAVIAYVMNLLAGMVSGSVIGFIFAILIYLVGHAFNLVMSLLSAYVHDSRLQYIEFFSKFYEGGGYAFKPLSIKDNHVDVVDKKENV